MFVTQVQKRKARERTVQASWIALTLKRERARRLKRRADLARTSLKTGDLRRVLVNLQYVREHGDPKTSDKLIDFITTFARKGSQQARKHAGVIKTATGGSWGVVREMCAGLKVMGLPRANKLIRAGWTRGFDC